MAVVGTEDNRKKILKQFFRIISFNKQMAVINKYYTIYLARHSDRFWASRIYLLAAILRKFSLMSNTD